MRSNANPIVSRLEKVHDQWTSFVQSPDARLLIWQVRSDEAALIDAFVTRESEVEAAQTTDLFLQLTSPFASKPGHGLVLVKELMMQSEEALPLLGEGDAQFTLQTPRAEHGEDDVEILVRVLAACRAQLVATDSATKLAVWLDPEAVDASAAYLAWLQRLVQRAPGEIRFFALDRVRDPTYGELIAAEPARVMVKTCDLNMPAALEQLAEEPGQKSPGDRLRVLQTRLGSAIGAGDLEAVRSLAEQATELAVAERWPQHAAVAQMMLGAGLAMHDQPLEARKAYSKAEQLGAAHEAQETEAAAAARKATTTDPAAPAPLDLAGHEPQLGQKLRLQARLAQGAVMIAVRAFEHAADAYMKAAPIAQVLRDLRAELDCYRLASVCFSELRQADTAWEVGMRAFRLGLALDDETRRTSTMPYLADHLLRMTERHGDYRYQREPLEKKLEERLGKNWRDQLIAVKG